MSIFTRVRRRFRRRYDYSRHYAPEPGSGVFRDQRAQAAAGDAPTVAYEPHGIDTPETLAEIVTRAQAEAGARAAQASAETEQWGAWDQPPAAELAPPPPMPYPGDLSNVMVHRITYPDPADLSLDKDRRYRDMLRRVGVATGTHTSLEDTGMWALPALEPGDGTGVQL
jgi:hypothetical protein